MGNRATLYLDGENEGAVEAIEETVEAVEGLAKESKTAARSINTVMDTISRTGGAIITANQALDFMQRGWQLASASASAFFSTTEQGQAQWAQLSTQTNELKGLLFELLIGTRDTDQAFQQLSQVIGDVTTVARAVISVFQPLTSLIGTVLGGALSIASNGVRALTGDLDAAARASGALDEATSGLTNAQRQATDQLAELLGANDQVAATYQILERFAEEAAQALVAQVDVEAVLIDSRNTLLEQGVRVAESDEQLIAAKQRLTAAIADAIIAGDDLDRVFADVSSQGLSFGGVTRVLRLRVDDLEASLRSIGTTVGDGGFASFLNIFGNLQTLIEQASAAEQEQTRTTSAATIADRARAEALAKRNAEQARAIELLREEDEARKKIDGALNAIAGREKVLGAEKSQRERSLMDLARKKADLELEVAERNQGKLEAMFLREQALDQSREQMQSQAIQGALSAASAFGSSITDVVTGQEQGAEAAQKFFGDVIAIAGQVALAQAAMRVFQPELGGPVAAVGLAIAGGAAVSLGRLLGSTKGRGGAAPTAAPAAATSSTTTNNTFVSNIGRLGSAEAYFQMVGEDFRQAAARGHIPGLAA